MQHTAHSPILYVGLPPESRKSYLQRTFYAPVVESIVNKFEAAYDVGIGEFSSKSRSRKIVNIRKIFSYVCRKRLGLTLKHTGEMINVDHTIVRYYVASYLDLYQTDKEFKQLADKVL